MGHNVSARAGLSAVLDTPVGHYATWMLTATCMRCRETRKLAVEPLITDGRGAQKVGRFIGRLACRTCRSPPGVLKLTPRPKSTGRSSRAAHEIILVGPGAY